MCGIIAVCGLGDRGDLDNDLVLEKQLDAGLERIVHRGPDGRGIWIDPKGRCAINDLSTTGSQPLHSPNRSIHAIINGELYYDSTLPSTLDYAFTGTSDSELAIALYQTYGLSFLSHLRGEFALILYDEVRDLVVVARDRYGIKPLFWRRTGEGEQRRIEFSAEVKGFMGLGWKGEWDVGALISGGWGQDTRTLFKGVQKLRPGHYMTISQGAEPEIRQYWDAQYPDKHAPDSRPLPEMISNLKSHLIESIRLRLRADVPVGIYLSGGIDSSAIAGIVTHLVKTEGVGMGSLSKEERVRCFSIGFEEGSGMDESAIAQRTANWLGVNYTKSQMTESDLASNFETAIYHCEHHIHDFNTVGKFILSRVTRDAGFKVVLTGEGADEQFAGYPLFLPEFLREADWSVDGKDGMAVEERRKVIGREEEGVRRGYEAMGANSSQFVDSAPRRELNNLSTPSSMTAFTPTQDIYTPAARALASSNLVTTISENVSPQVKDLIQNKWHPLHSALYVWSKGHLANQLLTCLGDRVEMAHSIEARTPFLDHVMTGYANSLPPSTKLRWVENKKAGTNGDGIVNGDGKLNGGGAKLIEDGQIVENGLSKGEGAWVEKWIMREAVKEFVTPELYNRRKHAYAAPSSYPRNGPIQQLLERLLTKENVEQLGFLDWDAIKGVLEIAFPGEGVDVEQEKDEVREKRVWCWRVGVVVASWVVVGQRFEMETARGGV